VPPETEKPKRRRGTVSVTGHDGRWHSNIGLPLDGSIEVCETLPGDVDPDAARRALDRTKRMLKNIDKRSMVASALRQVLRDFGEETDE